MSEYRFDLIGKDGDPFVEEARKHGIRRLEEPMVRERIYERRDTCGRCAALWDAWEPVITALWLLG